MDESEFLKLPGIHSSFKDKKSFRIEVFTTKQLNAIYFTKKHCAPHLRNSEFINKLEEPKLVRVREGPGNQERWNDF